MSITNMRSHIGSCQGLASLITHFDGHKNIPLFEDATRQLSTLINKIPELKQTQGYNPIDAALQSGNADIVKHVLRVLETAPCQCTINTTFTTFLHVFAQNTPIAIFQALSDFASRHQMPNLLSAFHHGLCKLISDQIGPDVYERPFFTQAIDVFIKDTTTRFVTGDDWFSIYQLLCVHTSNMPRQTFLLPWRRAVLHKTKHDLQNADVQRDAVALACQNKSPNKLVFIAAQQPDVAAHILDYYMADHKNIKLSAWSTRLRDNIRQATAHEKLEIAQRIQNTQKDTSIFQFPSAQTFEKLPIKWAKLSNYKEAREERKRQNQEKRGRVRGPRNGFQKP